MRRGGRHDWPITSSPKPTPVRPTLTAGEARLQKPSHQRDEPRVARHPLQILHAVAAREDHQHERQDDSAVRPPAGTGHPDETVAVVPQAKRLGQVRVHEQTRTARRLARPALGFALERKNALCHDLAASLVKAPV